MRIEAGSVVSVATDGRKCYADRSLTPSQVDQLLRLIEEAGHVPGHVTAMEWLSEGPPRIETT